MSRTPSTILSAALLLAACGGSEEPTEADPVDTTAPFVVSSTPAHEARGVAADASLTIVFSEPMDALSVESHLDTVDLGEVALSWNDEITELTITPNAPLDVVVAAMDSPDAPATYRVVVAPDVMDLAGNELGEIVEIEFFVVRELWGLLAAEPELTRTVTPSEVAFEIDDPLVVGDNESDLAYRATLSFDLSVLPGSPTELLSAEVTTQQLSKDMWGAPFSDLGTLLLDHVEFDALDSDNAINAAFNASQVAELSYGGIASSQTHVDVAVAVTDATNADLAEGRTQSQFLLYFDDFTDLDGLVDRAVFSRDDLRLEVVYSAP
ncbi:MAG: Ig-like domain-containing protein [Myxococcales bacterium]|nr:Ig-like domain-containing protein [Myxococcales bacterium]